MSDSSGLVLFGIGVAVGVYVGQSLQRPRLRREIISSHIANIDFRDDAQPQEVQAYIDAMCVFMTSQMRIHTNGWLESVAASIFPDVMVEYGCRSPYSTLRSVYSRIWNPASLLGCSVTMNSGLMMRVNAILHCRGYTFSVTNFYRRSTHVLSLDPFNVLIMHYKPTQRRFIDYVLPWWRWAGSCE